MTDTDRPVPGERPRATPDHAADTATSKRIATTSKRIATMSERTVRASPPGIEIIRGSLADDVDPSIAPAGVYRPTTEQNTVMGCPPGP